MITQLVMKFILCLCLFALLMECLFLIVWLWVWDSREKTAKYQFEKERLTHAVSHSEFLALYEK